MPKAATRCPRLSGLRARPGITRAAAPAQAGTLRASKLRGPGQQSRQSLIGSRTETSELDDWRSSVDNSDLEERDNASLDGRSTLATDRSMVSHEDDLGGVDAHLRALWLQATDALPGRADRCATAPQRGLPRVRPRLWMAP